MTMSRRELIGKMAVAGAVGLAAGTGRAVAATTRAAAGSAQPELAKLPGAAEAAGQAVAAVEMPKPEALPQAVASVNAPPPWELLRPLAVGSLVARGWRVSDLTPVRDGACVLTLQSEQGRSHRVHLCGNDGRPQGIVYSKKLDLVVMNGGQGDLPTDEGLAQAIAEVAHVLAANEARRGQDTVVTALLPHSERLRRFAAVDGMRLR